jgi:hypothetical protein
MSNRTVRLPCERGQNIGVEKISHLEVHRLGLGVLNGRKRLVKRREPSEHLQQRFARDRLDDEPLAVSAHNGVLATQLKLTRYSDGLITPIFEDFDVSFFHGFNLAYAEAYVKFPTDGP